MTSVKKRRMSMLDTLAAAGTASGKAPSPPAAASMMSSNRALRSARDAVDAHHVWELDPSSIDDERPADRLDPEDVADLRDAIETNGQTVPILVRRNPKSSDRYLLIYGRRRLEAIRRSNKVAKVRALVASMDDDASLRAQISENMARRDLSFIEKALFARDLVASGFGNQSQVAEVLTVSKSAISMAVAIVETVGDDLARTIGAAHGVGRPRWEKLARAMRETGADPAGLIEIAESARAKASASDEDSSIIAFEAVDKAVEGTSRQATPRKKQPAARALNVAGGRAGAIRRTGRGVTIEIDDGPFADWIEAEAQGLLDELHRRWGEWAKG